MSLSRMSLSGAIIILTIVVIRAIAINKLHKRMFLAFWGIAIVRLLLPISFPSVFNVPTLTNKSVPTLDSVGKGISDFTTEILANSQTGIESGVTQVLSGNTPTVSAVFLIWIVGVLLFAGYFIVSYLRCRCEFKTSLPIQNDFVKEWLSNHPLQRTMEVRSLTGISTPLTYGLIHPVILMPKNTDWENEPQLRYMLFHEYVHIRCFDTVSKLIVAATMCIHWFNPLVWVLYILFNRDIELACDERVIRHFGGSDRAAYARTLISMEEQRHGFAPFYSYFAKNAIEERIESIMKFRKKSMWALVLALVLVTVGAATAFATSANESGKDPFPTSSSYDHYSQTQHQDDYQSNSSIATTVSFISGMGCNDQSCTDISHHHDCPTDCTDYDHYHSCAMDCTETEHHHSQIQHQDDHQSDSSTATTASFISGMGCNDQSCTDISHHHDCPTDCTEYSHYHSDTVSFTETSSHHGGQTTNDNHKEHHKDSHH